jgi:hypothetical protein
MRGISGWGRSPALVYKFVMPGLVPDIHVFLEMRQQSKTWTAGTSPAMTW